MRWKELTEKRRNPEMNVKLSTLEELEKYAGRDDVFVSFVSDVGVMKHIDGDDYRISGIRAKGWLANISGHKIGINPRSEFATPNGIYCYPIKYIIDIFRDYGADFATDRPYAYVIQSVGNLLVAPDYTESDLQSDTEKLLPLATREEMDDYANKAIVDTPAGKLWAITRGISMVQGRMGNNIKKNSINLHPNKWSKIFRDLGYSGFYDSEGEKIIHENEPVQCVFFSKNAFKVLETVINRPPEDSRWKNKPEVVLKKIRNGELSDEKAADILYWNGESYEQKLQRKMNLPKGVVLALKKMMFDGDNIRNVPNWLFHYLRTNDFLTEDEMIEVLTQDSHLVRIYGSRGNTWQVGLTPRVEQAMLDLIIGNPSLYFTKSNFSYFMQENQIPDDAIFSILMADRHALLGSETEIPVNVLKRMAETDPIRFLAPYKSIIPYVSDDILSQNTNMIVVTPYTNLKYFGPKTMAALLKKQPQYIMGAITKGFMKSFSPSFKKAIANIGISYIGLFLVEIGKVSMKDAFDIISMMPKDDAKTVAAFEVKAIQPFKEALLARAK